MSFATFTAAGVTSDVVSARVTLPRWGILSGFLALARGDVPLAGTGVLVMGPLSIVCTIRRGGPYVGSAAYEVVGGADGWAKVIPEKSYRGPATRLSTLAQDAARLVGEAVVVEDGGDLMVGPYTRLQGPASRVLAQYAPSRWWVEIDGVTHVGDRLPTPAPDVSVLDFDPELGRVLVSDDDAVILPGQTFASSAAAGDIATVVHRLKGAALRTEIYLQ